MKEKLTSARFLSTLILTITFSILAVRGTVPADKFIDIYTIIILFYFLKKRNGEKQ